MLLSKILKLRSNTFLRAAAVAAVLAFAPQAFAQRPPTDLKGYGLQQYYNSGGRSYSSGTRTFAQPAYTPMMAVTPATPAGGQPSGTVAVRGPDGVVRYYPVEGGASSLAQRVIVNGQIMTAIRGTDGVVRYTPEAPVTTATPINVGVPCR